MFLITEHDSKKKLLQTIGRELDYLCDNINYLCDNLVPQNKEQEPAEIEDSKPSLECESPSYFDEIAKYVGKYFLVPPDSYILGRKVLAFEIVGYVSVSSNISRQQKLSVIELWTDGNVGCNGSSANVSRADYQFTINDKPIDIYADFKTFISDFDEISYEEFNKLISETIRGI